MKTGDQIGPNTIYRIAFIADEKREKKLFFKYLLENIRGKTRGEKIKKSSLVNFFIDDSRQRINKQRVSEMIQDIVVGLAMKEKGNYLYYLGI